MLALMAKAAGESNTGARRGSKGSSKGKRKASVGHESEIVSRLSTLCISMDRRRQALEDRSSYLCIIKSENLKKEVATLRAAWKEDEKARREEHEADKTKPLRNHVLGGGFRSVVAKVLFELLQGEAEARMSQVEQQAISCLVSLDLAHLDAAIFRARPRHPEPKADRSWVWAFLMNENVRSEIHLAMKSICAFHNATLFFAPQRSQDGPVVQWLRDMRKGKKAQGAGGEDMEEDMGTDNTKRPRRR